jgi:RNA polymerase sigma-70 factor (ECF subfamily)
MLGDAAEAEDVAQDVFVKAFLAIESFRGDSMIGTWLYRIGINLCQNRFKYLSRRQHGTKSALEDVPERAFSRQENQRTVGEQPPRPDHALEARRAEARIQRALAAVDPLFRELLILRDIQGLPYNEIMKITGLPEGTVKSRLHRARTALRRTYDAQEEGP